MVSEMTALPTETQTLVSNINLAILSLYLIGRIEPLFDDFGPMFLLVLVLLRMMVLVLLHTQMRRLPRARSALERSVLQTEWVCSTAPTGRPPRLGTNSAMRQWRSVSADDFLPDPSAGRPSASTRTKSSRPSADLSLPLTVMRSSRGARDVTAL